MIQLVFRVILALLLLLLLLHVLHFNQQLCLRCRCAVVSRTGGQGDGRRRTLLLFPGKEVKTFINCLDTLITEKKGQSFRAIISPSKQRVQQKAITYGNRINTYWL